MKKHIVKVLVKADSKKEAVKKVKASMGKIAHTNRKAKEELDLNKPWGVFLSGVSIGSIRGLRDRRYGKLIYTFDSEIAAKEKAKWMNKVLNFPREKINFKMKYIVKPIEKNMIDGK